MALRVEEYCVDLPVKVREERGEGLSGGCSVEKAVVGGPLPVGYTCCLEQREHPTVTELL